MKSCGRDGDEGTDNLNQSRESVLFAVNGSDMGIDRKTDDLS